MPTDMLHASLDIDKSNLAPHRKQMKKSLTKNVTIKMMGQIVKKSIEG